MDGTELENDWASWRPSYSPWLIAFSVMLATFMEVLDTSVANVSLPHIAGSLSATPEEATWVLTSYLVSNAIILPATGWFASLFGRKRFLLICIGIFTLASALCGMASSLGMIIIARILQGVGGGALQPIAQAVLLESFPPARRGAAMAIYGLGVVTAPIIGPTLGGWITDNYSWRWIFYINLPVGALAVVMATLFIEDPPYVGARRAAKIDYIGFGLMAIGLGALQIVLDKGQQEDWFESAWIVWLSVLCVLALVAFVIRELRTSDPIVDLRIFANRNFAVGTALITSVGIVLFGTVALLPLFLQTLLGYPAVESGLTVSPRGFGSVVSMIIVGRLIGRIDGRWLIAFGFATLAYSTYVFAGLNLEIASSNVMWPNVVSGFAMGFIFVPLTTLSISTLPNEQIGNATGVYNLMRNIGGSIGIALVTTMLARGAQGHQAIMVAHLTPYDAAYREKLKQLTSAFAAHGDPATATQLAHGAIYGTLLKQASLMAYIDNFRLLTLLCLLCIPLTLLFRRFRAMRRLDGVH
ncbi:MAG: EmrB/QacA family drug resistance transporter [Pyrinomonas sp.]|uniref:DHA2 family efflux MFS transporter permease subunit n=1 Tax=Pyrinomonas sp. TaxID=2080306 RepID=UPI0033226A53